MTYSDRSKAIFQKQHVQQSLPCTWILWPYHILITMVISQYLHIVFTCLYMSIFVSKYYIYIYVQVGTIVAYSFEWCPPLTCTVITIKEGWSAWTLIAACGNGCTSKNLTASLKIPRLEKEKHLQIIYYISNFEFPCVFFLRGESGIAT